MSALKIAVLAVALVTIKAQAPGPQQGAAGAPAGVAPTGPQTATGPMPGGPMVSTPTGAVMTSPTGGAVMTVPTGGQVMTTGTGVPTMNTQPGYYQMQQHYAGYPAYGANYGYPSNQFGYQGTYGQTNDFQYGNQGYPPYGAATAPASNRQNQQSQMNNILPLLAFGGDKGRQMAMLQSFTRGNQGGVFPLYAAMGGLGDAAQTAAILGGMGGLGGQGSMRSLPMWAVLSGNENLLPLAMFSGLGGQGTGRQGGFQGQGGFQSQRQSQSMGFPPALQYMALGANL